MTFFAESGDIPTTISSRATSQIAELLGCCEAFLRQASPATRAELLAFPGGHPTRPEPGWLIDLPGFDALFLQAKLAVAAEAAGPGNTAPEVNS
jgi:hypothetical protein